MDTHTSGTELHRSRRNRMLFGVAGGLGEYMDVDPVLIRLGFVVLSLGAGFGLLAYVILVLVMPVEDALAALRGGNRISPEGRTGARQTVALILIGLGLLFLSGNFGWGSSFVWSIVCPVLLIGVGLVIVLQHDPDHTPS